MKVYRYTLSPLVGFECRHLPTCSDYADQALDRFGLWAGGWMTLARLLRCQPWGTAGLDFVPERPAECAVVSALALRAMARHQWRSACARNSGRDLISGQGLMTAAEKCAIRTAADSGRTTLTCIGWQRVSKQE